MYPRESLARSTYVLRTPASIVDFELKMVFTAAAGSYYYFVIQSIELYLCKIAPSQVSNVTMVVIIFNSIYTHQSLLSLECHALSLSEHHCGV